MRRFVTALAVLAVGACAPTYGLPREIPVAATALRAAPDAEPADVAAALRAADSRVALVLGPAEPDWYAAVASAAALRSTAPGELAEGLGAAFLGPEALGDTTVELSHDRGSFRLHDALYELRERRFLDLLAFRIDDAADAAPAVRALLAYIATDVLPNAAVVMAVAVPSVDVGDAVARALSPGYFDARRCGTDDGEAEGVRLFYGPEALIFCRDAAAGSPAVGDQIRARLVMGRR